MTHTGTYAQASPRRLQLAQIGRPSHLSLRPVATAKDQCQRSTDVHRNSCPQQNGRNGYERYGPTHHGRTCTPLGCDEESEGHSTRSQSRRCGCCYSVGTGRWRQSQDAATGESSRKHSPSDPSEEKLHSGKGSVLLKPLEFVSIEIMPKAIVWLQAV